MCSKCNWNCSVPSVSYPLCWDIMAFMSSHVINQHLLAKHKTTAGLGNLCHSIYPLWVLHRSKQKQPVLSFRTQCMSTVSSSPCLSLDTLIVRSCKNSKQITTLYNWDNQLTVRWMWMLHSALNTLEHAKITRWQRQSSLFYHLDKISNAKALRAYSLQCCMKVSM